MALLMMAEDSDEPRKTMCTCCSVLAVATGLLFVSGVVLQVLGRVGFLNFSSLTALTLVALASTCFVVCGAGLAEWPPTAALGKKLIRRVTHTRSNWETDALRSFCEVGIWLSVIWATFQKSGGGASGLVVAMFFSTLAGCLLAIMGDILTEPLRALENCHRESPSSKAKMGGSSMTNQLCVTSGSMMMLVLYGHGAIQCIYEHCTDITIACLLASMAGLILLIVSKLIQFWRPMHHVGVTMQARIMNTLENWKTYPVRSAIESTFWGGIVIGTYELDGNVVQALQVGTVAGIVICLSSELFWHADKERQKMAHEELDIAPACVFAYGVLASIMMIFIRVDHWFTACVLSTIAGLGFTAAGQLCLQWTPTHKVGSIINNRLLNTAQNWAEYPIRSLTEVSLWLFATWMSYTSTNSAFISTGSGALTGVLAVLGNHAVGWGVPPAVQVTSAPPGDASSRVDSTAARPIKNAPAVSFRDHAVNRKQLLSWEEVAKHNTTDDAWLVIDGRVYDVSSWGKSHPGGGIIYKFAGVDATDQFAAFHLDRVYKRLPRFLIGEIETPSLVPPSPATLEYRALRAKLWKEGYFEPDYSYYISVSSIFVGLFIASFFLVLCVPATYFCLKCLGGGATLGLAWQQIAFLAHDSAHYGVFKPTSGGNVNWFAWTLASCFFGISSSMWIDEHSMHHAITLRPQEDPQFNYLPLWLISMKELQVPGTKLDRITKFLVSIQHFTFLPLVVLVGRFNFHLISVAYAVKSVVMAPTTFARYAGLADLVGMAFYWTWVVALVAQIEGIWARLAFVLTANWVCGILHVQLLLSHLFTETFTAEEEQKEQFFSFQLKTTRNIDCNWHWFHGGLEYQIEHHLFPQLPRHNLHRVKPFVQDICKRHGIEYQSCSFSDAFIDIMRNFRELATAILHCELG